MPPKPAQYQADVAAVSCCLLYVRKTLSLPFNFSYFKCKNRISQPHIPVVRHQEQPIWFTLWPWPPNCYLLEGRMTLEAREDVLAFSKMTVTELLIGQEIVLQPIKSNVS